MDEPRPQDTNENIEPVTGFPPEPTTEFSTQPADTPQPEVVPPVAEPAPQPFTPVEPAPQPLTPPEPVVPQPEPTPQPAAQPFVQPPAEPQSDSVFSAQPAAAPISAKKSKKPLFILLGVIVAVILALAIGFFVVKTSADSAATTYTKNAKTYLNDVYNTGTDSDADVNDVKNSIAKLDAPKLPAVFLGSISSKYNDATKLYDTVTEKVSNLTTPLNGYATVEKFYTDWMKIQDEMSSISTAGMGTDASATLKQFQAKFNDGKKLINDTKFPSKLSSAQKDLLSVYTKISGAWDKLVTAYDTGDKTAYNAALSDYNDQSSELADALKPFTAYTKDTAKQVGAAADAVKDYANTIKAS